MTASAKGTVRTGPEDGCASGNASERREVPLSPGSWAFGARRKETLPDLAEAEDRTLPWFGTREVAIGNHCTEKRDIADAAVCRGLLPHMAADLKASASQPQGSACRSPGRRAGGRWRNGSRRKLRDVMPPPCLQCATKVPGINARDANALPMAPLWPGGLDCCRTCETLTETKAIHGSPARLEAVCDALNSNSLAWRIGQS